MPPTGKQTREARYTAVEQYSGSVGLEEVLLPVVVQVYAQASRRIPSNATAVASPNVACVVDVSMARSNKGYSSMVQIKIII